MSEEEILIVNSVELNLICHTCVRDTGRSPRGLNSRRALREHMESHGVIVAPLRHENAGRKPKVKE